MSLEIQMTKSHQNEIVLETRPAYNFLGMLQFLAYRFLERERERRTVKLHITAEK